MTKSTNKRNTSIELLRIISMIMIVFHHFSYHGNFSFDLSIPTLPLYWNNFIIIGGKIGVDIFVLISGYFLVTNKEMFNFKRILKLWGQLVFYSFILYLLGIILGNDFGIVGFINSLMPIRSGAWWFAKTYFVLYLLHPYINILLQKLDKHTYQWLLILLVIMWSIIPTFLLDIFELNNLLWFIVLYATAGYERLYGFNNKLSAKAYIILGTGFYLVTYGLSTIFMLLGTKWSIFSSYIYQFNGIWMLPILLAALFLFIGFARLEMNYNKTINLIASTTFGVYLIHDSNLLRPILWQNIFKNASFQDTWLLIPYSILVVAIVFIVCSIIDLIRQRTFEKAYLKLVNKYADAISSFFESIINIFRNIIFGKD